MVKLKHKADIEIAKLSDARITHHLYFAAIVSDGTMARLVEST
jgi:hypothetical protein